ncbi:M50 family metallopeptidase [Anaerosinus sp.]|uniref:M50 family metallopeptidase n=1 Tax=Selenobaculum sp. TaxID=3074374 RepID=UPI0015A7BE49
MRIGKFSGIIVKINRWFIFLLALFCITGLTQQVLVAFISVFIHEITHVIVSTYLGVKVQEVELFPFGGAAKIERLYETSRWNQFLIFAAGPMMSLTLAAIFYGINLLYSHSLLQELFEMNFMLGWFNLIIATPLDGGRMLQIFLSGSVGYVRAGKISLFISRFICFIFLGKFIYDCVFLDIINFSILCVIVFIIIVANKESKVVQYNILKSIMRKEERLADEGYSESMTYTALHTIQARDIIKCLAHTQYHMVFVIDYAHHLLGTLTEVEIWEALARKRSDITLGEILLAKEGT